MAAATAAFFGSSVCSAGASAESACFALRALARAMAAATAAFSDRRFAQ
ncbi:hypothetical protein C408_3553 [Vibrio diabolicus E0666]|nr:hypothetical protein C408_3553 [Vibrio diabolicus E0666]